MPIEKEQRIFEIASYQFQDGQIVKMMFKYGNDNYYQPSFSWSVVMTLKNTYWKITIGDQTEVPEPTADDFKKLYSGKLLSIVSLKNKKHGTSSIGEVLFFKILYFIFLMVKSIRGLYV